MRLKAPIISLIVLMGLLAAFSASAARVYFSTYRGAGYVGENRLVEIRLDTEGQAINAGELKINFPQDKLKAVEVSDGGSIFNLFVVRPTIEADTNQIIFEGGATEPFQGDGILGRIIFEVIESGEAVLNFSPGSRFVVADGRGTVAETKLENFILKSDPVPAFLPKISSSTHPDSVKFYSSNQVAIQWERDIGYGYSYVFTKDKAEEPDDVPEEEANSILLTDLEDGLYWFGLKAIDGGGRASGTAYFRVMIDTTPPHDLSVSLSSGEGQGQAAIAMASKDDLSGIDYYLVSVSDGRVEKTGVPFLNIGDASAFTIKVFDKAGNFLEKDINLNGGLSKARQNALGVSVLILLAAFYVLRGLRKKSLLSQHL